MSQKIIGNGGMMLLEVLESLKYQKKAVKAVLTVYSLVFTDAHHGKKPTGKCILKDGGAIYTLKGVPVKHPCFNEETVETCIKRCVYDRNHVFTLF